MPFILLTGKKVVEKITRFKWLFMIDNLLIKNDLTIFYHIPDNNISRMLFHK